MTAMTAFTLESTCIHRRADETAVAMAGGGAGTGHRPV